MLGSKFARLIEKHRESLSKGLVQKLMTSERTFTFRLVPEHELIHDAQVLYSNLTDWLITRTELDVQQRYMQIGARRAHQGIPVNQYIWALVISKEHLWVFLQREAVADGALELLGELEFLLAMEQFFDRAVYYATLGYAAERHNMVAA